MNSSTTTTDEKQLDLSLQTLIATHGYATVKEHLNAIHEGNLNERPVQWEHDADPNYLLTLSPERRERILAAAVDDALPLYEADLARPEAERELTGNLETGELYEDYDAETPVIEARHA